MTPVELWKAAVAGRSGAEKWNNLPDGPRYQNDTFGLSIDHSKAPMLMRCGQQRCGGNGYWESPNSLNEALLAVIIANWSDLWPKVLAQLKEEERQALLACQKYVSEMQAAIDAAKETK